MHTSVALPLALAVTFVAPLQDFAADQLVPKPQSMAVGTGFVEISGAALIACNSPKCKLAESFLREESRTRGAVLRSQQGERAPAATVVLVDWSSESDRRTFQSVTDPDDRDTLAKNPEQGYILNVDPESRRILLIGGTAQGVLYGAITLAQLWHPERGKLVVPALRIRDYPDFRYRAAADWLLRAEVNRWAYDWGDGRQNFVARVKRKLDFALRYKINMVFFDGFGWNPERIPGYSSMMREFGRYARERGIKLIFGGYGSNYETALVHPEHNIDTVYLNRHYYPDGDVYPCIPGNPMPGAGPEADLRTRGTCRSNEELLRLKAVELAEFVRSVEPGALYIHFEDHGDFDPTQQGWLFRCGYCRRRWPNDDLKAPDGGAGALAHTYKTLYEAVSRIRNSDSGYDAARDCTVTMISPLYRVRETSTGDWNNVLLLWEAVNSLLPRAENLQIGFREIFPQAGTRQRWLDACRRRMAQSGLRANTSMFLLGGSQGYQNRYPFTANAILDEQFLGAETIYNFGGGVHQEPLQMLNAAFAWNAHSPGYRRLETHREAKSVHEALIDSRETPAEIFGPSGFLEMACRRLYGPAAAPLMKRYMTYSETPPEAVHVRLAPHFVGRLTPLTVLFEALQQDSKYWVRRAPDGLLQLRGQTVTFPELRQQLAALWETQAGVNQKVGSLVQEALAAGAMEVGTRGDLEYLRKCLEVGQRVPSVLAACHQWLGATGKTAQAATLAPATRQVRELDDWLNRNFRFETVCPLGGDQSSWLQAIRELRILLVQD